MSTARITYSLALALSLVLISGTPGYPEDLAAIQHQLTQSIPADALARPLASPPLVLRGSVNRGPTVYRQNVNGVVLIAANDGVGTGALVSSRGDIVTNHHVVEGAFSEKGEEYVAVWFKFSPGSRPTKENFLVAKVIRKDIQHDLALVRLLKPLPPNAAVIPLASSLPDVGQEVFVIGHPKSYLWSFTQGIVSQIRPNHHWTYSDRIPRVATAIQTQAPINPGNSGGPLFNDDGQMIGIVFGGATEAQGIFFAVASEHVRQLLP